MDCLNRINSTKQTAESSGSSTNAQADSYVHAKLFYAERNLYLTGSVLFLSLIFGRFHATLQELFRNEEKAEALKQQAAKNQKEYLKVLDRDQDKEKEVDELKAQLAEFKAKAKDLDIVKKQAAQTAEEYSRLTDRYLALEKKNASHQDGDDSKKAK